MVMLSRPSSATNTIVPVVRLDVLGLERAFGLGSARGQARFRRLIDRVDRPGRIVGRYDDDRRLAVDELTISSNSGGV